MTSTLPQVNATSGSKYAFVKGDHFLAFEGLDDLIDAFGDTLASALDGMIQQVRTDIRDIAKQDIQWSEFAEIIDVEYRDGDLYYVFDSDDPDVVQAALDLEYGGPNQSPNSLLRKYISANEDKHKKLLTEELWEEANG